MTFRILPKDTIVLTDLADPKMEEKARGWDWAAKGYLTREEAYNLFQTHNDRKMPANLDEVVEFLGGVQHPVTVRYSQQNDLTANPDAGEWRGDFNAPGFGAGNTHVLRRAVWIDNHDSVDCVSIVFNCNLVDMKKIESEIVGAALVIGPKGLEPEPQARNKGEVIELPLTLATSGGYTTYGRGGPGYYVPESKAMGVTVDTDGLRKLAGDTGGLEFFVRLTMKDGSTKYLNKDGQSGKNFEANSNDLAPRGNP